jgi:DNA-binding transcriptional MocR family regulator
VPRAGAALPVRDFTGAITVTVLMQPAARRLSGVASSPVRDLLALVDRPEVISFAGGLPAPELFDLDGLRASFDRVLSTPAGRRHLQYAPTEGNADLRALVAARMTARGLPTTAADLLVTTGSQQALTLIAAALLDPGAVVAVEEPTYLAAIQCFQLAGCRLVTIPSGLDPDALTEVLENERPQLLYLVPTFANPTGRTLSAERRAEVAALAARFGVWVVEDDPYGELRYRGEPVPALAAQDGAGEHVLHLGSFSKVAAPGLRLGWVRAPAALRPALTVAKQAADLHTSTIDQAAAADYLAVTDLDAHVRGLRAAYGERRDAMMAAMPHTAPDGSTWTDPDGGMFTWLRLPGAVDSAALLPAALARDVAFVPGAPFYAGRPDTATLRLSFTTHTPQEITEGMRRLGAVLRTPAP